MTQEITIKNLEEGQAFSPDGTEKKITNYRITSSTGEMYMTYIPDGYKVPEVGQTYTIEVQDKPVSFNWQNKDTMREYKKVKVFTTSKKTQTQNNPKQPTGKCSDVEYTRLAMEYLARVDKLNLVNLYDLSQYMKGIVDGSIDKNILGQLNLKYYNDRLV